MSEDVTAGLEGDVGKLQEVMVWIREVAVETERKGSIWKWNKQDLLVRREKGRGIWGAPGFWHEDMRGWQCLLVRWEIGANQIPQGQIKP